jgi:hypothetical protein
VFPAPSIPVLRREHMDGADVVQPIGQSDHQCSWVAGQRIDRARGVDLGAGQCEHLGCPGHSVYLVDETGHCVAELDAYAAESAVAFPQRVVQQSGRHCRGVHAQLGQDRRDGKGMRDVRIAGAAPFPAMPLFGDVVGPPQQYRIRVGKLLVVQGDQRLEGVCDRGGGWRRHDVGPPFRRPPSCTTSMPLPVPMASRSSSRNTRLQTAPSTGISCGGRRSPGSHSRTNSSESPLARVPSDRKARTAPVAPAVLQPQVKRDPSKRRSWASQDCRAVPLGEQLSCHG